MAALQYGRDDPSLDPPESGVPEVSGFGKPALPGAVRLLFGQSSIVIPTRVDIDSPAAPPRYADGRRRLPLLLA